MHKIAEEVGKIIAAHRIDKAMSQEALAEAAHIHRTYVSQIERGLKYPTLYVMIQIAKALEIPLSKIIIQLEKKIR